MRRACALVLTALVVLSTVPMPAASISTTGQPGPVASQDVPAGMRGVPDSNIWADFPDGSNLSVDIGSFREYTMASRHAGDLDVIFTTPERAEQITGITMPGQGSELALVLRDAANHEGRRLALPSGTLADTLGYLPTTVHGTHEDGSEWTANVRDTGDYLVFKVPHFSSNTVTFSGGVSIQGQPATDGSSYQYSLSDLDAVSDFGINVTGRTNYDHENATGRVGNGGSLPLDIAGNSAPIGPNGATNPKVVLGGAETNDSASSTRTNLEDGDSGPLTVGGNQQPTQGQVTFEGSESTTATTTSKAGLSDGSTMPLDVHGNVAPSGPSSNNEPQATFTGNVQATSASDSANGVSPSSTQSISVGGNIQPTDGSGGDPTLSVTAHEPSSTYNPVDAEGDGTAQDDNETFVGDSYKDDPYGGEMRVRPPVSTSIESIDVHVDSVTGSSFGSTIDVYIVQETPDGTLGEGTHVASWNPSWSSGLKTINISNYPVEAGKNYTVEFKTTSNNDGTVQSMSISLDTSASSTWYQYYYTSGSTAIDSYPDITLHYKEQVRSLSVSDGAGASTSFNSFADGETQTKSLNLSTSSTELNWQGSGSGTIDWSLDYTERTATEDPGLDWDGDGTNEAAYAGILRSGQTASVELSGLSTGSHTATISTTAGSVDTAVDWTAINATEDPSLSIGGSTVAIHSGILRQGETATHDMAGLQLGMNTLDWSDTRDGGGFNATLSWHEITHTEDPSVDTDGDGTFEINYNGILSPGQTTSYDADLSTLTSSLGVSTNNGSEVQLEAQYREVTKTEDPTIEVNGNTTDYLGKIGDGVTKSLTTDRSWLRTGTNRVIVTLASMSADAPAQEMNLSYKHDAASDLSVDYTAERWSEAYNISKSYSTDQSGVTLTIPFAGNVISMRNLELRTNGGTWSDVPKSDYSVTDTTLTANLGSVSSGDSIEVRATGSKVRTHNGTISVVDPSLPGESLDTRIRIDSWHGDSYIEVPQTGDWNRVHYAYNETWGAPDDSVRIDGNGQRLRMPQAATGGKARVSTIPLEASPQTGDVVVKVINASSTEPKFRVGPGQQPGDTVDFTLITAQADTQYDLYSETNDIVLASDTANSPLTLSDDDSSETISFQQSSGSSSSGGGGGGGFTALGPVPPVGQDRASPFGIAVVVGLGAVILVGLYFLRKRDSRQPQKGVLGALIDFIESRIVLTGLGIITLIVAVDTNVIDVPARLRLVLIIGMFLGGAYLALRRFNAFQWRVYGVLAFVTTVLGAELIAPGFLEAIAGSKTFTQTVPLLVIGGLYLGYKFIKTWRRGQVTRVVVSGRSD
ncbi:MAG: hypothetical protein ABEI77_07605 [Halorientalis sp.]